VTDAESVLRGYNNSLTKASNAVSIAEEKVDSLTDTVNGLEKEFETNSAAGLKKAFDDLKKAAESLGIDLKDIPMDDLE
jgi:uncharacterized protein YbjQ (UPF0145 family)